ncbi:hypothetical protein B7P43_G02052 [Cryptotermes secundus]|uniref:Novel acetylcholine receptor chaperone n=1 Tax=Cryptotermes secundus TaxID=105785 RepID=A0A2J7QQW3_9NEOP|nr:hypothetical protein B7P43_G02052 [Cryptotermes secundus]
MAEVLMTDFSCLFEIPRGLRNEQGCNFESRLVQKVLQHLGVSKMRTGPRHPQAEGIVERYVNTRKEYVKYAKVFPLSEALDFKVPSKWYRRTVGTLEIICGLAMAFIPSILGRTNSLLFIHHILSIWYDTDHIENTVSNSSSLVLCVFVCSEDVFTNLLPSNTYAVKQGANIVLLIMMMMAVYSHYMVNDKFERIAPALVR